MTILKDDPTKDEPAILTLPPDDPDVIALAKAQADLEAAEKAETDPEKPEAEAKPEAAAAAETPPEEITIPKARFDEVNARLREAELDKARLEGALATAAELAKAKPAGEEAAEEPQLTPEQVDAHFDKLVEDVDAKFDAGELSAVEWRQKARQLEKIRNETLDQLAAKNAPAEDDAPVESLSLAEATNHLVKERPWIEKVTADEWEDLRPLAIRALKAEGIELGTDEQSTVLLRGALIMQAEKLGWNNRAGVPAAKPVETKPEPGAPKPTTGKDGKPLTPEQVKAKVELALGQPALPEGSPGADSETPDPASITSEEDIYKLPDSTRAKIMADIIGGSP